MTAWEIDWRPNEIVWKEGTLWLQNQISGYIAKKPQEC